MPNCLAEEVRRLDDVDLQCLGPSLVPIGVVSVDWRLGHDRGVVDEYVNAAPPGERLSPEVTPSASLGEVSAQQELALGRDRVSRVLGPFPVVSVMSDERGARLTEDSGRRSTYALGGPREQDRLPTQIEHSRAPLSLVSHWNER